VTGLGVVAPAGIGVDAFWKNIRHGLSAVGRITKFDPEGLPSQIAAEVTGFEPEAHLPRRDVVRTDTFIHYALAATHQALLDARLEPSSGDPRIGVSIGTALGGLPLIFKTYDGLLREQMRGVNPYAMPGFLPNMAAAKAGLNKAILDAGWAQFANILTAKAESAGRRVVFVNPARTSITCHLCGRECTRPRQDTVICPAHGRMDADVNGARNIATRAGLGSGQAPAA